MPVPVPTITVNAEFNDDSAPGTLVSRLYAENHWQGSREVVVKEPSHWRRRPSYLKDDLKPPHGDEDISPTMFASAADLAHIHDHRLCPGDDVPFKARLAYGSCAPEQLTKARSTNDLLEMIYDVLEAHRINYGKQAALRLLGDTTPQIIPSLLIPSANPEDRFVLESRGMPTFIRDILYEHPRPQEQRCASCLLVDPDQAMNFLEPKYAGICGVLPLPMGTPTHIARSVGSGQVQGTLLGVIGVQMPLLTGDAKLLYIKAHGQEHYDRFTERTPFTRHGAIPPGKPPRPPPPFIHRPCHDVESICWTMLAVLMRVQPQSADRELYASPLVVHFWQDMYAHDVPANQPGIYFDKRDRILFMGERQLRDHCHPEMHDVADLLHQILWQVTPEYEFWTPRPPDDHLHEAVQRLILQYLVDHRDKDIPLDSDHLRPMQPPTPAERYRTTSTVSSIWDVTVIRLRPSVDAHPKRSSESDGERPSKRLRRISGSADDQHVD